jgi:hypothetical protein
MNQPEAPVKVRKSTGELADFDLNKLRNALSRSGAGEAQIEKVINGVRSSLYDGIPTRKIYQIAYGILRKISYRSAGRYRLKKAILELGPTGFPFERFVARLLESRGYSVRVGQIVHGKCVSHEVDVVAIKGRQQLMVECKFHHDNRSKSDVKIPLYIHSRFLDVEAGWRMIPENRNLTFKGMVVTNSRFTEDAIAYGKCAGLTLVSWDYPSHDCLKDWIDESGFHPITSLQNLTKDEKQKLLEQGIVLCREIHDNPDVLNVIVQNPRRLNLVLKEVKEIT